MCRSNRADASSVSFVCDACGFNFFTFSKVSVEHYRIGNIPVGIYDYCARCANDHTFICSDCDEICHNDDKSDDVECVCQGCADDNYSECERCNDYVPNDDTVTVQNGYSSTHNEIWCQDCAERHAECCSDCETMVRNREIVQTRYGDYICRTCQHNNYYQCYECDDIVNCDDYAGDDRCCDCYISPDDDCELASYGSEEWRSLRKYGKSSDYLGIEIELESKHESEFSDNIDYLHQFDCYCALERDGSLTDYGVEIQTTCADLETHRVKLKELYSGIMSRFKSESRTGIHISMDGDSLKSYHKGKIWTFINASYNEKFIDHIARRRANGYCSRYTKYRIGKDSRGAVNMQNRNRLELRIFRSTVRYERIIEFLEFSDCLRSYVRSGASWSELGYYDLLTYALKVKKYPSLVARIMEFVEQ